ncbi:helix-turn-helix domain-containing protein [Oricola sp.]|uniref:helix-turn-helix domain-containing protein n=1 Tax=Oricola sp. TaxID=1979950 RepID=UPI0025EDCE83|nr:helix-turn-helix domain-containing protein [Oricola sp.]MCI5075358.1 helix-turn-helix domain-containing protein [Oricola sp.]
MPGQRAEAKVSTTAQRAGALLRLLAQHPQGLGITYLARELSTQRAPLYRILQALQTQGLVRRNERKQYLLGVATLELARAYSSQFPTGIEAILAALANETGMTATLTSEDDDVLTTIVSKTPGTNGEHVFTPPGFRHPSGPLSLRVAVQALQPPNDDDTEEVREARELGYAIGRGTVVQSRYGVSAVVPGGESGAVLVLSLVTLHAFDHRTVAEPLLRTVQELSHAIAQT